MNKSFTGAEGESIAHGTAGEWTRNYRQANPGEIQGHFFGHQVLDKILAQKGCIGIRMYYALDDKQERHLILVGVDKNSNDMLNGTTAADGREDMPAAAERVAEPMLRMDFAALVANDSRPSPPFGSEDNILNS